MHHACVCCFFQKSVSAGSFVPPSFFKPWLILLGSFHYILNEIRALSSLIWMELEHVIYLANDLADSLAKQGVDGDVCLLVFDVWLFGFPCFVRVLI